MLPKKHRLTKKKDFEKVLREGKGVREDFLFFKWISTDLRISRFGFVVGKKISKKATVRNKMKRRLREIMRVKLPKIKKSIDGVFITNPGLEKKEYSKLQEVVDKILTKAKLSV